MGKGNKENFRIVNGVSVPGILAFVIGAAVAYVTANIYLFFIGPINGIVISLVAYVLLVRVIPVKEAVTVEDDSNNVCYHKYYLKEL